MSIILQGSCFSIAYFILYLQQVTCSRHLYFVQLTLFFHSTDLFLSYFCPINTRKRVPITSTRYPLSNFVIHWTIPLFSLIVNFLGFRNKFSFLTLFVFSFSYPFVVALYFVMKLFLFYFLLQELSFLFSYSLFVCLHFSDKIDCGLIWILCILWFWNIDIIFFYRLPVDSFLCLRGSSDLFSLHRLEIIDCFWQLWKSFYIEFCFPMFQLLVRIN